MRLVEVHGHLRNLNWRPSRPDPFAKVWQRRTTSPAPARAISPMDAAIGLDCWDQSSLGSCTAHGNGGLWAYRYLREHGQFVMPSRLFIYYCERMMEGTVNEDSGAIVHDGTAALIKYGVPPESEWPYNISQFTRKPPAQAWVDAKKLEGIEKNVVPMTVDSIRSSLQADNPVVFGFTVYESFMSQSWLKSGLMPLPQHGEQIEGGHCVVFVGDAPDKNAFWVRNSWGTDWAIGGRFLMPYAALKICSDGVNLPKVA